MPVEYTSPASCPLTNQNVAFLFTDDNPQSKGPAGAWEKVSSTVKEQNLSLEGRMSLLFLTQHLAVASLTKLESKPVLCWLWFLWSSQNTLSGSTQEEPCSKGFRVLAPSSCCACGSECLRVCSFLKARVFIHLCIQPLLKAYTTESRGGRWPVVSLNYWRSMMWKPMSSL